MARKSRKVAAAEPVCEAAPLQIFPTAIYARLSVENSGKSEKVDEEAIQQGHQRMQELDSEHPCSDERLDAVLGEYQKGAGLTYELAHALISAIYIHGHDSIEIVWQFKDIFEDAEI